LKRMTFRAAAIGVTFLVAAAICSCEPQTATPAQSVAADSSEPSHETTYEESADSFVIELSEESSADETQPEESSFFEETAEPSEPVAESSEEVSEEPPAPQNAWETTITDMRAIEILKQIADIAAEYDLAISYRFDDLRYHINGLREYSSASTIKPIFCQYLYENGLDDHPPIVFESDVTRSSTSGKLTTEHKGESFFVEELIGYALRESDNMAYRLLYETFGTEGFNAYVSELGIPGLALYDHIEYTHLTANELTDAMWYILMRSKDDPRLTEHLINASYKWQIAKGTDHTVASKYGYQQNVLCYHDTAIVYAPKPYVLTVMSGLDPNADEYATDPFIEVTRLTDALHAILCGET